MTDKQTLKGAVHLHTTLSHDGVMSLAQLAAFLKGKGYDYMALTEHSYDVDDESMQSLVEEAARLSSPDFTIIPGLEFRCHGWVDIIGYGVTKLVNDENASTVIDHIHRHGGVAVFAHPNVRDYPIDNSWVAMLDGCEIWNVSNEGKFLPRPGAIRKFEKLAQVRPGMLAFTGLDLHRTESYCGLALETHAASRQRQDILAALRAGHFVSRSPLFSVGASGKVSGVSMARIRVLRAFLDGVRSLRNLVRG